MNIDETTLKTIDECLDIETKEWRMKRKDDFLHFFRGIYNNLLLGGRMLFDGKSFENKDYPTVDNRKILQKIYGREFTTVTHSPSGAIDDHYELIVGPSIPEKIEEMERELKRLKTLVVK